MTTSSARNLRVRAYAWLCAFCVLFFAPDLAAQQDTTRSLADELRAAHRANRLVRVHILADDVAAGRIVSLQGPVAFVGRRSIALSDIAALEVRISKPDPLLNGTLIGGAAGTVILYPLFTELIESIGESRLTKQERLQALAGTFIFGAVVGFFVDAARERPGEWHFVWTR